MTRNGRLILAVGIIIIAIVLIQRFTTGGISTGTQVNSDIPASSSQASGDKEDEFTRAKEFVAPGMFFNTEPFTVESLIGKKVMLIDFWTYSCINCQRTQPYLNAWYAKYRTLGLEIIGVHTPEFEFEKVPENVRTAIAKAGIQYPVVQDNEYGTWRAYGNQYWPRKYLIDTDGFIIYDHIGEGAYDETEREIQKALSEHMTRLGMKGSAPESIVRPSATTAVDFNKMQTQEIYFGSLRNAEHLGNATVNTNGNQTLMYPADDSQRIHMIYLKGEWEITDEYMRCIRDCGVRLHYSARQVNLVAASAKSSTVGIRLDGNSAGAVNVKAATLYRLIERQVYGEHTLELSVPAGVDLFTFTFS